MTLRRALTAGLLGLALVGAAPASWATAAAPAYPPTVTVSISLSASVVQVGVSVRVSGGGFRAGSTVQVSTSRTGQGFARPQGFAPAVDRLAAAGVGTDGSGSFTTSVSFSDPGTYVVTASGLSAAGVQASAAATVLVVPAGGGVGGPGAGSGGGPGAGPGSGSGSGPGSASGVGGSLPNTGASIGLPITAGVVLVLVGAGLVTVVRRRRRGDLVA